MEGTTAFDVRKLAHYLKGEEKPCNEMQKCLLHLPELLTTHPPALEW